MRLFLLLVLLLPMLSQAQTIHRKKNEILYKGKVDLPGRPAASVLSGLQQQVGDLVKKGKGVAPLKVTADTITAKGDLRLDTDFYLVRTAHYTLTLVAHEGSYAYRIDSVYVNERKRDGEEKIRFAKDLFKSMDISGPVAQETEKLLNEIDLNFQKILAVLRQRMQKAAPAAE